MRQLPVVTNSELRCKRRCDRLHQYKYVLGWEPATQADELHFGTMFHAGLEGWWQTAGDVGIAESSFQHADDWTHAKLVPLMHGYHEVWKNEPYTVHRVEHEWSATIGGVPMAGKFDAVAEDAEGSVWIVEHKTSAEDISPGSAYFEGLALDSQVSTYLLATKNTVAGVLYDVIGKPALKPLKATPEDKRKYVKKTGELYANQRADDETPDEYRARITENIIANLDSYYRRVRVTRLESELEEATRDIQATYSRVLDALTGAPQPRNPESCRQYGRLCAFFDVCTGSAELAEPRFRKKEKVHSELGGQHATSDHIREERGAQELPNETVGHQVRQAG